MTTKVASPPTDGLRPRAGDRRQLAVAGRLTWRDGNGTLRFASVLTRDVSDTDVFLVCEAPTSIPKYRLVHFQVERAALERADLPAPLRAGRLLSAVYRVGPRDATTGTPKGYAIRLLNVPATRKHARPLAVAN